MVKAVIVSVVILLIVVAVMLFVKQNPSGVMTDNTAAIQNDSRIVVTLNEQNNSGQSGTVTLVPIDEGMTVTMEVNGGVEGVSQPAHIHNGTCDNVGGVVVTLPSPMNGFAEGDINTTLEKLKSAGPLAINVHKSDKESNIYVACGNLVFK